MSQSMPDRHSLVPRLVVDDPAQLVAFLKLAFAANGELETERPTQLQVGDSLVMVSATGPRPRTSSFFYLYVADVDAAYARALAAGGLSLEEPQNTPYGHRRAMIEDPCGNAWQIASPLSAA